MRHERSAAKRASILDGGPSGGYKRQHRLQRGAPLYCVNRWDFAGRAHHEYSSFFRLAPGRLLFGPTPHDPLTLGFGTGALAMVACAAGYILALRASRLDPIAALVIE